MERALVVGELLQDAHNYELLIEEVQEDELLNEVDDGSVVEEAGQPSGIQARTHPARTRGSPDGDLPHLVHQKATPP
jgi:hypothetical protein